MPEPTGGPSLSQGPDLATNSYDHSSHKQPTLIPISAQPKVPSPQRRQLDDASNSFITRVVQTVSILHYVDRQGNPRGISTVYATPQTVLADPVTGDIVGPVDGNAPPENPDGSVSPDQRDGSSPEAPDAISGDSPPPPGAAEAPEPPGAPETPAAPEAPLPPDVEGAAVPASPAPEAPATSAAPQPSEATAPPPPPAATDTNASSPTDASERVPTEQPVASNEAPSGVSSGEPTDNPTGLPVTSEDQTQQESSVVELATSATESLAAFLSSSLSDESSSISAASSSFSSVDSSTVTSSASTIHSTDSTSASASPTSTDAGSPRGGGGLGGGSGGDSGDSGASDGDGDDAPTPTGTVVGSVVGSVAGVALIIMAIMMLLRWRRQKSSRMRLEDGPGAPSRGLGPAAGAAAATSAGAVAGDHDSYAGDMAERSPSSTTSGGVLAAMAALNRSRSSPNSSQAGSPFRERGFYRVSGKKLPSVIHHGGDGYSDPRRHSTISGASSGITTDHGLDVEPGAAPKLAVGQPMRPVSGVPVIRSSPARTPVEEGGPFMDPFADPMPSPPTSPGGLKPDGVGRSLRGHDASRASSSKFMEDL